MTGRNPSRFPNYTPNFGFMGAPTVTNYLKDAGYVTGHVGKWNIGPDAPVDAQEYGILDFRRTGSIPNDPRGREGERFDEAIDFITTYKDSTFYLNIWIFATHKPISPPNELRAHFDGLQINRNDYGFWMQETFDTVESEGADVTESMKNYLADMYGLDVQVGRLLDTLDELGISNNTLLAFSSDNGPQGITLGATNQTGYSGGLRGIKHSWYEGGTRVPFIARWPGKIPAGKKNMNSFISGMDWLPTVCTITGANYTEATVEGEDMSDVLFGNDRSRIQPVYYSDLNHYGDRNMKWGKWKSFPGLRELYDLEKDPFEMENVYSQNLVVANAMESAMDAWIASLPEFNRDGDPLPFDPMAPLPVMQLPNLPTPSPTVGPTALATEAPSLEPSESPSSLSTEVPSMIPSASPSAMPTTSPVAFSTVPPSTATTRYSTSMFLMVVAMGAVFFVA